MIPLCDSVCGGKSVLKGRQVKTPKRITVTDHLTDLIQAGKVDGDKCAIIGDHAKPIYTFMELDLMANKIAKSLRNQLGYWTNNNSDGDLVIGFCLGTSPNVVCMMLAILKLGGTYLSLSPTYPEQQIVRVVGYTRPLLIVTESDPHVASRFDCVKHICEIIQMYKIIDIAMDYEDDPNDPVPLESLTPPWKRCACIYLTAGATAEPKFVRIGHQAILCRLYWQFKQFPYAVTEIGCLSSVLQDAESIAEIFAPLLSGKPLFLFTSYSQTKPQDLLAKVQLIGISRLTLTPFSLNLLLDVLQEMELEEVTQTLSSLKYMVVSGDTLPYNLGVRFFETLRGLSCSLIYFYGATETAADASYEIFTDLEDFKNKANTQEVPIGIPLGNCKIYVMDEELNVVSRNVIGEICIFGGCVGMGYTNEYDTTVRFVNYPLRVKKSRQGKLFRTGDYGKVSFCEVTGKLQLYYHGRMDMSINVFGKEVALNDIAIAVKSSPLCDTCAVLCYHKGREDQAAVAFCVLKNDVTKEMMQDALRERMKEDVVVPDVYPVKNLPYLPSGKLDRQALLKQYKFRKLESSSEDWKALNLVGQERQAAKTLLESLSHTFGLSLRYVMKNYDSSFWQIGGNSLNAVQIVQICRDNGYLISVDAFIVADQLRQIVISMTESIKYPLGQYQLLQHFCDLAEVYFEIINLQNSHKQDVIRILSEAYCNKSIMEKMLDVKPETFATYVELLWDIFLKEKLSLVVVRRGTNDVVAVTLNRDINSNYRKIKSALRKLKGSNSLFYCMEAREHCDAIIRKTTIGKERNTIIQPFFMGTDASIESRMNILLIKYLLRESMAKALFQGFSWLMIMTTNPLIRDICTDILQCDLIAELKLSLFISKDKTKPFRSANGEHQKLKAFYRLFT